MVAADSDKAPYSTLSVALAVLSLVTLVIAPSRLPLLLIPGSFLLAAYGMGLLLERTTASWFPVLPSNGPILTFVVRVGTGMSVLGCATTVFGVLGLYRFSALLVIAALGWGILRLAQSRNTLDLCTPTYPALVSGFAVGMVWAIAWLWATIPPTFYDELAYHLPIPQYALRTDHIPSFPWLFFNFMPHL